MLLIEAQSNNPFYNLATEEYLLKEFRDDIFLIYKNKPVVIIGKHQNTYKEINMEFVRNQKLPIARRLSGGGAVYHDLGNLNFTFINNGEKGKFVDFVKYTKPILAFLSRLGVPAELDKRNNIFVQGKKISGNAEHIFKNRVLHHGTLLFSTDLDKLNRSIAGNETAYSDRGVKSVRANVTNISEYLTAPMEIDEFSEQLLDFMAIQFVGAKRYEFTEEDITNFIELSKNKYKTWDWNYGYSPDYEINKSIITRKTSFTIYLKAEKAIIKDLRFSFDTFLFQYICDDLIGQKHDYATIYSICHKYESDLRRINIDLKELVYHFF